jgi:MFS family permease
MALTKTERTVDLTDGEDEPRTSRRIANPWILVVVIAGLLLAFGWTFLQDPSISAPTRDPAWYTWRSNLMMHDNPGLIAGDWGPFSMFGGGYRISVPLYGSILQRVAGIDLYTFSAFMMVGVPILTGLALGAFSWRRWKDPLLFVLVMLSTAALFMTTPYVGYLDNITVLFVLSMILAFFEPGRTSWGARVAMFLLSIVAAYTHPTTCVIFGLSLMGIFGLRVLTSRFHLGPALKELAPSLMSVGFGMMFGLASWLISPWGVAGSLADAALPPPYTQEVFQKRLSGWVDSLQPMIIVPLIVIAIAYTIFRARKNHEASDEFGTISTMLLLPFLGTLGWIAGAAYPYYRFMNATMALFSLVGLGAYVVIRFFLNRPGPARIAGFVAAIVLIGSFGYIWMSGRDAAQWADPENQWIDQPTRTSLSAARAIVENEPADTPVLFVVNFRDEYQAYGWAKTFTNVSRTGLPGDAVKRSMTYFGAVEDLEAGQPTQLTDATYNKMARGFWSEVEALREEYTAPPLVFLVRQFNEGTENIDLLDSNDPSLVKLSDDVAVVTGDGFATPSPEAVADAQAAEQEVAAFYADHPGIFGNLLHNAWVILALALMLVLPGLLVARFAGLDDAWTKVALIPGLSIGLTVISGIIVVTVTRSPFGVGAGWASVILAVAIAAGLRFGERAILGTLTSLGNFFNRMFSTFSNPDFAALMGNQYLVMAADGLIRGSIAKSIAFGGQEGFDITTVPSANYLLKVVLLLYVPYTVLSPFIGVVIDRFERRRVLAVSAIAAAAITAALAVLIMAPLGKETSEGNVGATIGLVVAMIVSQAVVRIALAVKSAALPGVLRGKDLLNGNGLSQAGGALFQVLGAGFAFAAGGALPSWAVVILGGIALIVAAAVALRIKRMEVAQHVASFAQEAKRVVKDIVGGIKEVASRPAAALGLTSFQMLRYQFWGFALGVFALYARSLVASGDVDTIALGIVGGGGFVGGALGMVLAQRWKDRVPPIRMLLGSMVLLGASALVFGFWVSLAGFSLLLFAGFFSFFLGKISADTIMQQAMPDDFRGRAFALFDIAYNLGFIIPAVILVLVWEDDRAGVLLVASGVVFLALTALVARWASSIRADLEPQDDLEATAPEMV